MKVTLKALGFDIKKNELQSLFKEYDIENKGAIDYPDYVDLMTRKYAERDPLDEVRMAFRLFVGDDSSGKITVRALRKISRELKENLSEEELTAMIDEFDFDSDGMSELNSFRRRVYKNNDWKWFRDLINFA